MWIALLCMSACSNRDDSPVPEEAVRPFETANHFLRYPNHVNSLAAGDYELVIATTESGVSGNYQLELQLNNEAAQTLSGQWQNSSGPGIGSNNPRHAFRLTESGGLVATITSDTPAQLILLQNSQVVAQSPTNELNLPVSRIDNAAYAEAYYKAVDPNNERTTLADWKRKNGFINNAYDAHVIFRDTKDLGYGRNMHMKRLPNDGVAFFVENYVVDNLPTPNSEYSILNLEAAIYEDPRFHLGTNAIEFSPQDESDPDSPKILKIFTFAAAENDADAVRLNKVNLDGRGDKFMPLACVVCHGGVLLPLNADGSFPEQSLRSFKPNLLEQDSFELSTLYPYDQNNTEAGIRAINMEVQHIYEAIGARPDEQTAHWHAGLAVTLAEGHYLSDTPAEAPETDTAEAQAHHNIEEEGGIIGDMYHADFIPAGWKQNPTRPQGVETLYQRVVRPHCIACHSLRGTTVGEITLEDDGISYANAINFNSYEQFISYADIIEDYVFKRGLMPLSLRNYRDFWRNPNDKPALLASFLPDFTPPADGILREPGEPVARPGSDRTQPSPVQLDGRASLFASQYQWQILSTPAGATASLSDATHARPVLTADINGSYVLGLIVSNQLGHSPEAQLTVTVDDTVKAPSELTFVDDVMPILGSTTNTRCSTCHQSDTDYPGIPVLFSSDNPNLYADVRARIDFNEAENSQLLRKPTRRNHGGGVKLDLNDESGKADANTLLNWIRAGGICGNDATVCASFSVEEPSNGS